jgi:hypothetical protein
VTLNHRGKGWSTTYLLRNVVTAGRRIEPRIWADSRGKEEMTALLAMLLPQVKDHPRKNQE